MSQQNSRRITSVRQLELLVDFMERHKDLALGRVHSKEARALAARLWKECAVICNAEGTFRTPKEWGRYWNDFKGRVKAKLRVITQSVSGTGGGPATDLCLSPIEDRVAAILGKDVVTPLEGVQQNPFFFQNTTDQSSEISNPQQLQETYTRNTQNEFLQILVSEPSVSEPSVSENIITDIPTTEHNRPEPQSTAGSPAECRPQRSERRHRVQAQRRSLLSQQVQESTDETRAAFLRLEEAKIAAQAKQIEVELKKVEALQHIAQAINKVADAINIFNPGSSSQHVQNIRKRHRRISSSDGSDH